MYIFLCTIYVFVYLLHIRAVKDQMHAIPFLTSKPPERIKKYGNKKLSGWTKYASTREICEPVEDQIQIEQTDWSGTISGATQSSLMTIPDQTIIFCRQRTAKLSANSRYVVPGKIRKNRTYQKAPADFRNNKEQLKRLQTIQTPKEVKWPEPGLKMHDPHQPNAAYNCETNDKWVTSQQSSDSMPKKTGTSWRQGKQWSVETGKRPWNAGRQTLPSQLNTHEIPGKTTLGKNNRDQSNEWKRRKR